LTDKTPGRSRRLSLSGGSDDYIHRSGAGSGMHVAAEPRATQGYVYDEEPLPGTSDNLPLGADWSCWRSGADRQSIA
jgi:hypothetical protein